MLGELIWSKEKLTFFQLIPLEEELQNSSWWSSNPIIEVLTTSWWQSLFAAILGNDSKELNLFKRKIKLQIFHQPI